LAHTQIFWRGAPHDLEYQFWITTAQSQCCWWLSIAVSRAVSTSSGSWAAWEDWNRSTTSEVDRQDPCGGCWKSLSTPSPPCRRYPTSRQRFRCITSQWPFWKTGTVRRGVVQTSHMGGHQPLSSSALRSPLLPPFPSHPVCSLHPERNPRKGRK